MSPITLIEDALAEGRSVADLAGRLRDKLKSGAADLKAVFDEAEAVVDGAVAKARAGLAAFKAEVEKADGGGAEVGGPGAAPAAGGGAQGAWPATPATGA